MEKQVLKPSNLKGIHPWNSVDQKSEMEDSMAWMVMKLQENGDTFREVSHDEYKSWDGWRDKEQFKHFQRYLKSPDTIVLYSPAYQEVADKLNMKSNEKATKK